ncbi:uncharacterized protein TNCV_4855681 [Trichonephila clavipes]|nr:uncharacterized protein TNCV_4855681 [Trichonephila clavipes]
MIVPFRNEKVSNHGSIPITIDCNVVAFIVFEEGFHQPIKRTKQVTIFEETGSLNVRSGRGRNPVFSEAIEKVALQVEEDKASNVQTSTSVRRVAEALDRPRSTAQKIMRNTLRYYPRKLQLVQELLPHDFETRHLFSLQFLARLGVDPEWPWNILWTDEAHFHLDGSVNTHNYRIWETDNPHSTLRVPLHSPKVTVWCGFFRVFYFWPVFFRGIRCWKSSSMFYHWTVICIVIME